VSLLSASSYDVMGALKMKSRLGKTAVAAVDIGNGVTVVNTMVVQVCERS
jgi:hypothetical protein